MSADTDLLAEIRENRIYATTELDAIRAEAKTDKLCVAGKPWQALDPQAVKDRQDAKRPFLAADELGQYLNQTVNDVRANPLGIKFAPTGNGANDAGAEFYQNHTREIEYRSHASVAYATAFQNCIESSYGWVTVTTKRQHVRTFDQDLFIEPVVNPDQILPDPQGVWPDSRDIKFLYHVEPWSRDEYKRRFPKSKAASFTLDASKLAPGWIDRNTVQVAKYWKLETVSRRLVAYRLKDGPTQTALVDELPDGKLPRGADNLREESVDDTKVRCWLTNGLELLKEQPWAGKYIPYVSCYGKSLYVDEGDGSRRVILSMTRLARDPYMSYCYMVTCRAEAVGGVPRAQFVGYEGQFAKPDTWKRATQEPVAYLEAKATVPGNPMQGPLPLPRREAWDPPLQNLEIAIESSRRAIQAAMGISPLPTPLPTQDRKLSGKAMDRLDSSGQRGSYHFKDSYKLMVERVGVIIEDLLTPVLDTARDVPVRTPDDSANVVRINDPAGSEYGPNGQLGGDPIFTKGDYRVTVSTGPATESQRVEAAEFVEAIVGQLGQVAQLAGPVRALKLFAKSVKLKQLGPIGDEIIDLLDPPQLGADGKPLPPEVAQLLGENQQLKQLLQRAAQEKQAKVIEQQGKFQIASMQEQAETDRAAADREVKLAIAELGARVDRLALFLEESRLVGARAHERDLAFRDRVHDSIERAKDRLHERVAADAAHANAMDLSDQNAAHASDAAVQQAALQPDAGAAGADV